MALLPSLFSLCLASAVARNPNTLTGVDYVLADGSPASFRGDYFEVTSQPVTLSYAQVYWTLNSSRLPQNIIDKYNGSAIVITGFEAQRFKIVDGQEVVVPAFELYNHHWNLALSGSTTPASVLKKLAKPMGHASTMEADVGQDPMAPRSRLNWNQGNGNEDRATFRGWAKGYGDVIESPTTMWAELMLINTKNPTGPGRCGPLPRVSPPSRAPREYSALLECPCSDRRVFDYVNKTIDGWPDRTNHFSPHTFAGYDPILIGNPSYNITTYIGGLHCCNHLSFLTDKDQEFPGTAETYYMKFRFYYEDYVPGTVNQTDGVDMFIEVADEWDITPCSADTPPQECITTIARNTTASMFNREGELIYVHAHLHLGGIDAQLYDLTDPNSPKLLCNQTGIYGTSNEPADESGYLVGVAPCVFGHDGILPTPPVLSPHSPIRVVARYNSTNYHTGVMSYWENRVSYFHAK